MKSQTENRLFIPEYALSYLIEGNTQGIEAQDKAEADNWLNSYLSQFAKVKNYVISSNSDIADMFNKPTFGRDASCFDCSIAVMYN